jgi:tetratricopeptide (TPR) repeat protein
VTKAGTLIDVGGSGYFGGVKDHELRVVQERLEALAERVSEIGQAQDQSDDTVATLASALSDLVGRMRKQDRLISLNSFVAYAIFTVLLGAAFFMLYRGRAGDLELERDQATKQLAVAEERAQHATRELAERDAAEKSAAEIYELLRDHRYKEAIAARDKLESLRLTPAERGLLVDAIDAARGDLAEQALERGREAFGRGELDRAIKEAQAGIEAAPSSESAPALHYLVGSALNKQNRNADALVELDKALAGGVEKAVPDARYVYANVLDKLDRRDDARAAYRAFAAAHPKNPKAPWARTRAWQLSGPAPAAKPKPAATPE